MMVWSPDQIQAAAIASREAGMNDAARHDLLSQIPDQRAINGTHASSKSPRLTNADFEWYMAECEVLVGGRLSAWGWGYWSNKRNNGPLERVRYRAQRVANTLELTNRDDGTPYLEPDGRGLRGWINKQTNGRTDDLNDLSIPELRSLIDGLCGYGPPGLRKRVAMDSEPIEA